MSDDELGDLEYNDFDLTDCHIMSGHTSPNIPTSSAPIFNLLPDITSKPDAAIASARKQLNLSVGEDSSETKENGFPGNIKSNHCYKHVTNVIQYVILTGRNVSQTLKGNSYGF